MIQISTFDSLRGKMNGKKTISVVTPCYNEEENVEALAVKIKEIFDQKLVNYEREHIFIDNCSTDSTLRLLNELASKDHRVKIIANSRNFGHIRSPYYGLLQSTGDCAILMASDFQDPPENMVDLVQKWEQGNEIVLAIKNESHESPSMFFIRKIYYDLINRLSEIPLAKNYTGFGLYDSKIINLLKQIPDPYPYFRGLILELGFKTDRIYFTQPIRKRGITKNNFFTLYDMAMLGICTHSKIPLRIATISGFVFSLLFFIGAVFYFLMKLIFWNHLPLGQAPLLFGLFLFASLNLLFIGIIGEYVGWIFTKVSNRPLVIEKYRTNFV